MSFTAAIDLATNPAFVRRVTGAAVKAAVSVGTETYDGSQYVIIRRALSTNVLHDPVAWGERFAYGVTTNAVIAADSLDGDIEFTVNSLWDAMAGAFQETP